MTKYNFHTVLSRTKGEARYHRGHDFAIPNSLTGNVLAIHVESVVTKDGAIVKEGETIFLGENCSFWKKIVDKLPGGGGINGLNALEGAIKRSTEELQVTLSETNVAGCLCLYSIGIFIHYFYILNIFLFKGGARVIGEELYNDNHAAFLYRIKDKLQLDLDAIKQHDPRVVNYNWIPDSELLKLSETQEGSVKFIAKTLYDVVNGKRPLIEISSMEKAYETEGNGIYLRAPLF